VSNERDDENQWLNAGATYAHDRWLLPDLLTLSEIYALGQAVSASGGEAVESVAADCERQHPELHLHEVAWPDHTNDHSPDEASYGLRSYCHARILDERTRPTLVD